MFNVLKHNSQLFFWTTLIISVVTLFTPATGQAGLPYVDKAVHFVLFFVLLVAAVFNFGFHKIETIIFSLIVYVVGAEFIQYFFVPGRSAEAFDILAGILGILLAQIFLYWYGNKLKDKI